MAGYKDVAVYDNSLLEWSTDLSRPMESDGEHVPIA
jgi:3-mercaptopyruvate sulfurtransferase SseA